MTRIIDPDEMMSIMSRMGSPLLGVAVQRCLLVRNRNADCLKCASVCTTGAISADKEGIKVNPDRCIGCGTCASACPTCCLEALNPSDEELASRITHALQNKTQHVAFACETALAASGTTSSADTMLHLDDGTEVIGVTCLGRVEESVLIEAVARGAHTVTLVAGSCRQCAHASGGALCDDICSSSETLLSAMGSNAHIERKSINGDAVHIRTSHRSAPANIPERPRRTDTSDLHLTHVQKDGTLPHHLPLRRRRLFNCLKHLGSPQVQSISTRLWGQVDINTDLCRSCRMCTVFCPTGALSRFGASDESFGVEHRSTLCVQCRMCETICPEHAITVSESVDLEEFLTGKKIRFVMKPLDWNPGGADAIATRMTRFIKTDNLQDPQAKLKPEELAAKRRYSLERQKNRSEAQKQCKLENK